MNFRFPLSVFRFAAAAFAFALFGAAAAFAGTQVIKADTKTGVIDSPLAGKYDFTGITVLGVGALPNQAGNSGKIIQTDGTTGSWTVSPVIGQSGAGGTLGLKASNGNLTTLLPNSSGSNPNLTLPSSTGTLALTSQLFSGAFIDLAGNATDNASLNTALGGKASTRELFFRRDATDDTRAYITRLSVSTVADNAATTVTVANPDAVRAAISVIYGTVGKANLVDAWFLGSNLNVIPSTTVPAFLKSANNGTLVGSTLPTVASDGVLFTNSYPNAITLPTALNSELGNFTDIIICQPSGDNVSRGAMGNYAQDGTGLSGYYLEDRWSSTPINQIIALQTDGVNSVGEQILSGKPAGNRWQTIAASYTSGTQRLYLNGRLVNSATSYQAIDTTNRQIVIGAQGFRVDAGTIRGGFNGKIIFACKLRGVPSPETVFQLCSALRGILSPQNAGINFIAEGDSRTAGMTFSAGTFSVDVTSSGDEEDFWPERLMLKSNWAGKAVAFKIGTSGDTVADIINSGQYESQARSFVRAPWQKSYVSIWVGVNDFNAGGQTASYVYNQIVAYCNKAKADGATVIVINQPPNNDVAGTQAKIDSLNAMLTATPPGDYLIDISGLTVGALYDGLHLTSAGRDYLAGLINSAITSPVSATSADWYRLNTGGADTTAAAAAVIPTGTGFNHITSGAQDSAAKLIDLTTDLGTTSGSITLAPSGGGTTHSPARIWAGNQTPHVNINSSITLLGTDASDAFIGAATTGQTVFLESSGGQGYLDVYDYAASAGLPLNVGNNATRVVFKTGTTERARLNAGLNIGGSSDPGSGNLILSGLNASQFIETDSNKKLVSRDAPTFKSDLGLPTIASTSSVLKGDGAGNAVAATAGTDYASPPSEQTVGDANVTWTNGKTFLRATAAPTASRTVTLPAANAYPPGTILFFTTRFTSSSAGWIFQRGGSDTLNGGTPQITPIMSDGSARFETDGTSAWTQVDTTIQGAEIRSLQIGSPGSGNWVSLLTSGSKSGLYRSSTGDHFAYYDTGTGDTVINETFSSGASIRLAIQGTDKWKMNSTSLSPATDAGADLGDSSHGVKRIYVSNTVTGSGTTGAQTINKQRGTVRFAAAASTLVVTDSLVSSTSKVIARGIGAFDATATNFQCTAASGSFTITANSAATAETEVYFEVAIP